MASKKRREQILKIVSAWVASGNSGRPIPSSEVAQWAINTDLYKPPQPQDPIKILTKDISEALRHEYFTDNKGRPVRAMHAVQLKLGGTIWDDIRTAPRKHMQTAFKQRREQIVGDCYQLRTDADLYNTNHPEEEAIQIPFNFMIDMIEKDFEYEAVGAAP